MNGRDMADEPSRARGPWGNAESEGLGLPARLTLDGVVPFLIRHALLDPREVVDQRVRVVDVSRRNSNVVVHRAAGTGYFIKQSRDATGEMAMTVANEAMFYAFCAHDPRGEPVRAFVPRHVTYVADADVLVTSLVEDATSLWQRCEAQSTAVGVGTAARLGSVLSTLHQTGREVAVADVNAFGRGAPWALSARTPGPEFLTHASLGQVQVTRILQEDTSLSAGLDALQAEARVETLIHGDLKADNILIGRHDQALLVVVDWELAHIGDPAWDVGSTFFDFLRFWLTSIPLSHARPERSAVRIDGPLRSVQSAIRAFWDAYRSSAKLEGVEASTFLERAARFCAARLVQGAYELTHEATEISRLGVLMLQVASNMFAGPDAAVRQIFAIPHIT